MSEFEHKATSHIPPEILNSISREVNDGIEGSTPLEAIMKARKKGAEPIKPVIAENAPQQKQYTPRAVDGFVLNVPHDPYQAGILLFSYLLAKVWGKDPKVAKVLKQFNFNMQDINGEAIYPPKKKKK